MNKKALFYIVGAVVLFGVAGSAVYFSNGGLYKASLQISPTSTYSPAPPPSNYVQMNPSASTPQLTSCSAVVSAPLEGLVNVTWTANITGTLTSSYYLLWSGNGMSESAPAVITNSWSLGSPDQTLSVGLYVKSSNAQIGSTVSCTAQIPAAQTPPPAPAPTPSPTPTPTPTPTPSPTPTPTPTPSPTPTPTPTPQPSPQPGATVISTDCSMFTDVSTTDSDCPAIGYVNSIGAMTGNPDGTFRPNSLLQRDQIAKIILVTFKLYDENTPCGRQPFPDVMASEWSYNYICTAAEAGLITGYQSGPDKGFYRASRNVTRAEFLALLLRSLGDQMPSNDSTSYNDVAPGQWYSGYAKYAMDHGLFTGLNLNASSLVSRREVARIIYKLYLQGKF